MADLATCAGSINRSATRESRSPAAAAASSPWASAISTSAGSSRASSSTRRLAHGAEARSRPGCRSVRSRPAAGFNHHQSRPPSTHAHGQPASCRPGAARAPRAACACGRLGSSRLGDAPRTPPRRDDLSVPSFRRCAARSGTSSSTSSMTPKRNDFDSTSPLALQRPALPFRLGRRAPHSSSRGGSAGAHRLEHERGERTLRAALPPA